MSDPTPNATPETGTPPQAQPVSELEAAKADAEKWKKLSRQNEERAKENAAAAARLAEIEESTKTETQKAAERAAKAEARVKELEAAQQLSDWKAQVAAATGIPAAVLYGDSLEALTAHAEAIKALLPGVKSAPLPNEGKLTAHIKSAGGDKAAFAKGLFSPQR